MKNHLLQQAKKELLDFHTKFEGDDILLISEDKNISPFAHVLYDKEYEDCIILSIAVDYPIGEKIIDLALTLNLIAPVIRAESFFVNNKGNMSWGDEAYKNYELENVSLEELEPLSDKFH